MNMSAFEQTIREIEAELGEDDVGLWVVVRLLRDRFSDSEGTDIRLAVAHVCRVLQQNGAALGQFTVDGYFEEWPVDSAVDRILVEWCDLGRDPDIGEIAWLRR